MSESRDLLSYAESMGCESVHLIMDKPTDLRGIIVVHSTKRGPAVGGCRLAAYDSTAAAAEDAIRLAQGMTYKSALAGLSTGGGKAALIEPKHIHDREAYFKAYGRFVERLGGAYITAVDSGSTVADMDVVETQTKYVTGTSSGQFTESNPSYSTALGVFSGMRAAVKFHLGKDNLKDVHVAVQGLGQVGYALLKLLSDEGAKTSAFDVRTELVDRAVAEFGTTAIASEEAIIACEADIFSPCALSGALNDQTIAQLGAKIIVGGANIQLVDPTRHAQLLHQKNILYVPDFAVNAGGLMYVEWQDQKKTQAQAREKVLSIYDTILKILVRAKQTGHNTYEVAKAMAEEYMMAGPKT